MKMEEEGGDIERMKEMSRAAFLLLVCTSGNPSRTPEQGFL